MAEDLFKDVVAPKTEAKVEPVKEAPEAPVETPKEASSLGSNEGSADPEAVAMDELTFLKQRADLMGLKYSNNIGIDTLRQKIKDALEAKTQVQEEPKEKTEEVAAEPTPKTNTKMGIRERLYKEKMRLVRLRITNLDPKKADLPGEIFTVANRYLGVVRKFVPFGEMTDNGYHVPYCIYEQLRDRQFLSIRTRKGAHGTPIVESQYVREFALEVLPPLTSEELAKLSTAQLAAGGMEA